MKTLHKTILELKQDLNIGEYGLSPLNVSDLEIFDSTWSGIMVFHDVFEHWFEETLDYFKGENSCNVSGEVVAMGALSYYYDTLGLPNRLKVNTNYSHEELIISTTQGFIEDAIMHDSFQYGETFNSIIPTQEESYSDFLESIIDEHWSQIEELEPQSEEGKIYKQSLSKEKLANCYRFGFELASKIVDDKFQNTNTLYEFIEFWDTFTKNTSAEDLYSMSYETFEFTINEVDGFIQWECLIESYDKTVEINSENLNEYINIKDFYYYGEEEMIEE